jgi:hypothetical protein
VNFIKMGITAVVAAAVFAAPAVAQTHAPKPERNPFDANNVKVTDLLRQIQCVPHEPVATSDEAPAKAVVDGDRALAQGHCQLAVADYQREIDVNQQDGAALFRQFLAALAIAESTGDAGFAARDGEIAYHDADLGVAAQSKNPVFLYLRAVARVWLIGPHIRTRNGFSLSRYVASERRHSFDDDTAAIALQANYGQAYAGRWMIDLDRQDIEQANYDHAQAQKFDPAALQIAEDMQQRTQEQRERNLAALARSQAKVAAFMTGLAVAAGAVDVVPVYTP